MRILIINDLVVCGGAELQTFREADLLREAGHEVLVLTLDESEPELRTEHHVNIPYRQSNVRKTLCRVLPLRYLARKFEREIRAFDPDVIRANNVWKLGAAAFAAMQGYPVVQTVRDYLTVCIRGGVDPSGNPCDGYAAGHCQHTCCGNLVDFFELLSLRCYNYQRRRVVSQFIAPSRSLAELCTQNGLNTIAVANPFYAKLGNLESISERNRNAFLYYGQVSRDKGVPNLLIAWKQFGQRHGNASLRIIGSIADDYRDEFTAMIREMPGVEYNDAMANSEILGLLPTVYCVIVPSIWMENYPNTVLESQAVKTLVIGSDRGGIREMITEPSLRFDPRDPQCLVKVLEAASALNDDEYGKIVEAGYQRVITENGPETYRQRIVAVIGEFRSPRGGVEAAA